MGRDPRAVGHARSPSLQIRAGPGVVGVAHGQTRPGLTHHPIDRIILEGQDVADRIGRGRDEPEGFVDKRMLGGA